MPGSCHGRRYSFWEFPNLFFESQLPDGVGPTDGTPLHIGGFLIVPGSRGDAFVASYNVFRLRQFNKPIIEGMILPATAPFAVNDFLSVMSMGPNSERIGWKISQPAPVRGRQAIYLVDPSLGEYVTDDPGGPQLIGYLAADVLTGDIQNTTEFIPDQPDPAITKGSILRVSVAPSKVAFCEVDSLSAGSVFVKASTPLPANSGAVSYWKPTPAVATVAPAIEFTSLDVDWDTLLRDYPNFYFWSPPGAEPEPSPQQAMAFSLTGNPPTVVALGSRWTNNPPPLNPATPFYIDGSVGAWQQQLGDTSSNPALSWEYWNGKGWWSLEILKDGTERLAATGALKFKVPPDIAESDWAGKTNFWIRARLVGGDYGTQEVTVISTPIPSNGGTEQVIKRSTANIRAPLVLDLHLSYSICTALLPSFVLTRDSGTLRDQSDANRTPGAIVEAFVPLALTLGRLTKTSAANETIKSPSECPPDCDCTSLHAGKAESADAASTVAAAATRVSGLELYIGLAATPSEGPVNVLLLVDERPHTQFAPLQVEALVADRFKPIVAGDSTRALGESGVLSMSFPVPPTRAELFGKENLTWLRLKPGPKATDQWLPSLRGAYLNAAWASATETLTRELLGSSNGGPISWSDLRVRQCCATHSNSA